jgi:hypothetical protein
MYQKHQRNESNQEEKGMVVAAVDLKMVVADGNRYAYISFKLITSMLEILLCLH